jgi:hypothetical protein
MWVMVMLARALARRGGWKLTAGDVARARRAVS